MPATPYPVSGTLYDTDGSTALSNVKIVLTNVNDNTELTTTTDSSGGFMFDLANLSGAYSNDDEIALYAAYGRYYDEHIFTVDVTVGMAINEDLTLETVIAPSPVYASVADIRGFTKAGTDEYDDDNLYNMIQRATNWIDEMTGRTWKGTQTETDNYYDGDDTDILWLSKPDVQSVTELSVDTSKSGTYTSMDVDDDIFVKDNNYIVINNINASITTFPAGVDTIKVSYTWGFSRATESVRILCILIVANWMNLDRQRSEEINRMLREIKWKLPGGLK